MLSTVCIGRVYGEYRVRLARVLTAALLAKQT